MADEFNRAVGNWWNSPPTIRTTSSHQPIIHDQLYSRDHENDDHDHMMITGGFLPGTEPSPDFLSTKGSPVGTAFSHSNSSVDSSSHGGNLPSPTFLTPMDSFHGLISSPPASDHQSGFGYIGMPISGCNSSDSFMGWTSSNKIGHDQFTHFLKPSMVEAKPVQIIQPHDQLMNVNRHGSFFSAVPPLLQSPEMAVPTFSDKRKNNMMEARNTSGAGRKSTGGSNRTSTTATASTTSTGSGTTTAKRPRNEASSPALPPFKVRKEKMGDRITALQQLVSPFGKTDTASVLSEAIEYIKFLHEQVNVLSTPYMKSGASLQHQQSGHGKFKDEEQIARQDLRSRGLCLVPVSSTFPVAHETTVDFWTPTFGPPGGFR